VTVTVDGINQTIHDETSWDSASDGCILWKDANGNYTGVLEFKTAPADGAVIRVYYTTVDENGAFHWVEDKFIGIGEGSGTSDAIEVYEVNDEAFIESYMLPNGKLDDAYLRLLNSISNNYKRGWGEFVWDNFYWDETPRIGVIASHYDGPLPKQLNYLTAGVAGEDDLALLDMDTAGRLFLKPGYFYVNGKEYYLYANAHYQLVFSDDFGNFSQPVPLQGSTVGNYGQINTFPVFPAYGSPIIMHKVSGLLPLVIGYSGHIFTDPDDNKVRYIMGNDPVIPGPGMAECYRYPSSALNPLHRTSTNNGHSHHWSLYPNMKDLVAKNGATLPDPTDGHYHLIIGGVVQPAGNPSHTHSITLTEEHGYRLPSPNHLRKRVSPPSEVVIPEDDQYFIVDNNSLQQTYLQVKAPSGLYQIVCEAGNGPFVLDANNGPLLDLNKSLLAGTFIGIGSHLPIKRIDAYPSRSSVSVGDRFGISIKAVDFENARATQGEVLVKAPAGVLLSSEIGQYAQETVLIGHIYSDGTAYGRLQLVSVPANTTEINLTVVVRVFSDEDWSDYGLTPAEVYDEGWIYEFSQQTKVYIDE
jgi:hypothetical protein